MWDALHSAGAGANNTDTLIAKMLKIAVRGTARVVVVPATGMEGVAFKLLDTRYAGEFGAIQRAVGHDDKARAHGIAPIGLDLPAPQVFVPVHTGDLRLQAGVLIQVIVACNVLTVRKNFRALSIFFGWHNAEFVTQGKINIGFSVAGGARIAVPIPSATEVAAFFDNANTFNARFF